MTPEKGARDCRSGDVAHRLMQLMQSESPFKACFPAGNKLPDLRRGGICLHFALPPMPSHGARGPHDSRGVALPPS